MPTLVTPNLCSGYLFFLPIPYFVLYNSNIMDEEILSLIKSEKSVKTSEKVKEKKSIWLIFTIGEKRFAIPAETVKEILRDATVFPLPFVPAYIDGILNRYGDPYVVINPATLEGYDAPKSFLFIVLNDESHSCLRITDVKDFFSASEKDVVQFNESELSDYYDGTLKVDGEDVFVMNIQAIIEKVGKEIAAA